MNVFLCFSASINWEILPQSRVWANNFLPAFRRLATGIYCPPFDATQHALACLGQVRGVDPVEARERYSDLLYREVEEIHRKHGLDLFFSYLASSQVLPETIDAIRRLGIPTVNFYCNAAHQFHLIAEIAPHFDWCMVPERQAVAKYMAVGARPVHVQMAADLDTYQPYDVPLEYDVTFVGQRYLNRADVIAYLNWHGVDTRVWGPRWRDVFEWEDQQPWHWHARRIPGKIKRGVQKPLGVEPSWYPLPRQVAGAPLSDEEMVKMYSRSRISLNVSEVQDELSREVKRHIRLRDFEGPMSGAFYVTGYQEELAEYYDIGKEIICYDTKEELLDKVRYYLQHPAEREMIRKAGLRRARRDHTWDHRLRQMLLETWLMPIRESPG